MSANVYVLVALGLISVLFAIVMLMVWRWIDAKAHLLAWAAAFVAASCHWGCLLRGELLRGGLAEDWVLGNAFAVATVSLVLAGFRMRAGLPARGRLMLGGGCVILAAVIWFAAIDLHRGLAAGLVPVYSSALLLAAISVLLRGPAVLAAEWASVSLLGLLACVLLASGGFAIISCAGGAPDWMQLFAAMHFLTVPAAYAGIGTCMVFLVATDLSEQMKQLAITDQLTGVLNRRGFQDGALRSISQARRTGAALTAVMADLDHFKRINDTYGHGVGDLALRRFAAHLSSELRQGDLVGRVGGEEFALLLVDTDIDGGRQVAHRLCHSFALAGLETQGARVQLTASFGVAALDDADGDVQDLLDRADRGLYMAKEMGRNRVCVSPSDPRPSGYAVA